MKLIFALLLCFITHLVIALHLIYLSWTLSALFIERRKYLSSSTRILEVLQHFFRFHPAFSVASYVLMNLTFSFQSHLVAYKECHSRLKSSVLFCFLSRLQLGARKYAMLKGILILQTLSRIALSAKFRESKLEFKMKKLSMSFRSEWDCAVQLWRFEVHWWYNKRYIRKQVWRWAKLKVNSLFLLWVFCFKDFLNSGCRRSTHFG